LAEKRLSRKELLKEPDEFLTTTGTVVRYAREHPRHLALAAAAVFAVFVVVAGYYYYQQQMNLASHNLFQGAYREYEAAVNDKDAPTPEKLDALLQVFQSIASQYPSKPAGEEALLYSGHVLFKKMDYKGALETYTKMQNTSLVKKGLGPMIMYHIADTHLALKDYDPAILIFEQLSRDTNSPYRREASVSIARIYEMMDKGKEALQAYRQYLKTFPEAPDAAVIKARIAQISAKG
jgi:TolA-binding protein